MRYSSALRTGTKRSTFGGKLPARRTGATLSIKPSKRLPDFRRALPGATCLRPTSKLCAPRRFSSPARTSLPKAPTHLAAATIKAERVQSDPDVSRAKKPTDSSKLPSLKTTLVWPHAILANSPNRRVVVLMFRVGSSVSPGKWPCPAAVDGVAGCKQRFWSDGETRRSSRLPNDDREFSKSKDTFACRFYQRLTTSSPCERKVINFQIRLFDKLGQPIPNAPYQANQGVPLRGKADQTGTWCLQRDCSQHLHNFLAPTR